MENEKTPSKVEGVFSFWVEIESCRRKSHSRGEQEFTRVLSELSSGLINCDFLVFQFHRFELFRCWDVWLNAAVCDETAETV